MLPIQRKEYAPGDVIIDKYRLLQLLGEGGMGSVWVAENMALKANVALKLIRADVAEASANDFMLARPFSNSSPSTLSMFTKRPTARPTKLL